MCIYERHYLWFNSNKTNILLSSWRPHYCAQLHTNPKPNPKPNAKVEMEMDEEVEVTG